MGKKIIFLEDKPEKLKSVISEIKGKNEGTSTEVLYYAPEILEVTKEEERLGKLLDTEIKVVNLFNFDKVLDELYREPDNLFVFDTVLSEENIEVFAYRINISYALRKKQQSTEEKQRIWFYTVAGLQYLNGIKKMFGNYVLQAQMEENNLKLDFDGNESFQKALRTSVSVG